ncbi:MAG: glycosyltransferase, partial [Kiritimatiellae bacterium]|nr:glycosyltransferase [Kiritimatiellia bacterium]
MKISLITACFKSAGMLRTALDSVLEQKGVDLDYIVVDGGSDDGTVELLKEYEVKFAGRMRWISEKDQGMYDAINKGIKMATGDVVGILNADDMLESPETLAQIADAFADGVDVVYADIRFVKEDLQTTVRYYGAKHWRPWMFQWGKMPPHPSVYIRRELFGKLGFYKLGYDIAADYELLVRYLRKAGVEARYLDSSLVRMRMGGKSTRGWRSNLKLNQEIVRANRENGYFCCLP